MSILENIYIFMAYTFLAARVVLICPIRPTYKAIYWEAFPAFARR
jgi:hypothetical protein